MNKFVSALKKENNKVFTENGAKTYASTLDKCVDLFFQIGAMRGQEPQRIVNAFTEAFREDVELAIRILLWARDIRGGAGERESFRIILKHLELTDIDLFCRVANRISEIGRWDDLLVAQTTRGKDHCFKLIAEGLLNDKVSGLVAKWMPRKGPIANELREWFGQSPRQYRKTLVGLTNVVETKMCAKEWDNINYETVPSLAMSRYTKAFGRHDPTGFADYMQAVTSGEKKINAGAVYPYDVLKGARFGLDQLSAQRVINQWDALPNYMGDEAILPMIDVSGSMNASAGGTSLTCMDVSTSLGLYLATKSSGPFKDICMTFHDQPDLINLEGNIINKLQQVHRRVGYNTNLERAFEVLLAFAARNKIKQKHMPKYLLVLSDMEFDDPQHNGPKFLSKNIKEQYEKAGYDLPIIVWWNIQSRNKNFPVKAHKEDHVLVSGFSPAIAKSILSMDTESMSPHKAMLEVIMNSRYDF